MKNLFFERCCCYSICKLLVGVCLLMIGVVLFVGLVLVEEIVVFENNGVNIEFVLGESEYLINEVDKQYEGEYVRENKLEKVEGVVIVFEIVLLVSNEAVIIEIVEVVSVVKLEEKLSEVAVEILFVEVKFKFDKEIEVKFEVIS